MKEQCRPQKLAAWRMLPASAFAAWLGSKSFKVAGHRSSNGQQLVFANRSSKTDVFVTRL